MRIYCSCENIPGKAKGTYILGKAEEKLPELSQSYKGKVQLLYLDPPEILKAKARKGSDTYQSVSEEEYCKLLRTVLAEGKKMLSRTGTVFFHINQAVSTKARLLADDILGRDNLVNEIIWVQKTCGTSSRFFRKQHETILVYKAGPRSSLNVLNSGVERGSDQHNHYKKSRNEAGQTVYQRNANGKTYYYHEDDHIAPGDVWNDIEPVQVRGRGKKLYPGQQPEGLMERILRAATNPGDIVLDPFAGSGTTALVAGELGREAVCIDASFDAMQTARARIKAFSQTQSMLDQEASFSFIYPSQRCRCMLEMNTVVNGKKAYAEIRMSEINRAKNDVITAVSGIMESGCFIPYRTYTPIHYPFRIQLPETGDAVLQLITKAGKQVFITVN